MKLEARPNHFGDVMDYRLDLKVSNNRILQFMEGLGYTSVMDLCRRARLNITITYGFVNLKECPRDKHGNWRKLAIALADALCCEPDDLFSEEQQYFALEKNRAHVQLSPAQIESFLPSFRPDERIPAIECDRDMRVIINSAMEELNERQRAVVRLRFGLAPEEREHTSEEIGQRLNITASRVRQIEAKALRKVRGKAVKENWGKNAPLNWPRERLARWERYQPEAKERMETQ